MDAIVVILLVVAVTCYACYKRSFQVALYVIASIDLFLRVVNFIVVKYFNGASGSFFSKMPASIHSLINKYLWDHKFFFELLLFVYVAIMACFLFYTICAFFKKK